MEFYLKSANAYAKSSNINAKIGCCLSVSSIKQKLVAYRHVLFALMTLHVASVAVAEQVAASAETPSFFSASSQLNEAKVNAGPLTSITPSSNDNQNISEIAVQASRLEAPADGQYPVEMTVVLRGANGAPVSGTQYVTVTTNGGWLLLDPDLQRILGPEPRPTDRATRGRQLKVENGQAKFKLIAPTHPQDVTVRLVSGPAASNLTVRFVPEHRPMIAVGLLEGIIGQNSLSARTNDQTHFNDAFERSIQRWSRTFGNDKSAAARASVFIKGDIADKTLLTLSYDSDKDPRSLLMRDFDPERFYPIYGDSSTRGFDARSSDRLYARLDRDKNYLLYGDFATGNGFNQLSGGGSAVGLAQRNFGQYNRTATGLRAHYEDEKSLANIFAIYDDLQQAIEEFSANGTSGPFAVRNSNGIQNSEKVEVIVRDKNQIGLIKQVTPLVRYLDYTFEPFSGRILLTVPVATLASSGDPQSIRITYEVSQGGDKFWILGADGQTKLGPKVEVGGTVVEDKNPLSPYRLYSVNAGVALSDKTRLVAELARSESRQYSASGYAYNSPSGLAGEISDDLKGNAERVEIAHADGKLSAKAYMARTDVGFMNSSASLDHGRGEKGAKLSYKLSDTTDVFGEAIRSEDRSVNAGRDAAKFGLAYKLSDRLTLNTALTYTKEDSNLPSSTLISPNTALLGSGLTTTGGFFGGSQTTNPIGSTLNTNTSTLSKPLEATTAKIGLQYKMTEALRLDGELEKSVTGDDKTRAMVGSEYQLTNKARLYGRLETQTGLASAYSLNPADRSTGFVAGVSSAYMTGANIFTEYRLQNNETNSGIGTRDMAVATGERHTWNIADGITAQTGAEYLKIFNGSAQSALALTTGIDYAVNPIWRASGKLEYRRLFDSPTNPAKQTQNQWLSTLSFARKMSNDWTFLARNYLLFTHKDYDANGLPSGNGIQDRAQLGFAWRPTETNRYNALARYEYKIVNDQSIANGDNYRTHIISMHGDYHPSRPWWMTGRLAAKHTLDKTLPADSQKYAAWLLGGRVTYDINKDWDVGVMLSSLHSSEGGSHQYAYGAEVGHIVMKNLWVSLGYNASGFTDRDLTGSEYTAKGLYLRLRFKFDESLFKRGTVEAVNDQK